MHQFSPERCEPGFRQSLSDCSQGKLRFVEKAEFDDFAGRKCSGWECLGVEQVLQRDSRAVGSQIILPVE